MFSGRVPYVSDFSHGIDFLTDHGVYAMVLAGMAWGLELSILLSCFLFLGQYRAARWLAWVQMPFRLLFVLPSVSIVFMGADVNGRYGIGFMLLLVVLSECLKGWTLWATRNSQR
jgi:hypothetical protein